MVSSFNSVFGRLFDAILYPFHDLNPWIAILAFSLITAIFMLLVYRALSDQEGIRTAKNRIAAHLLELRLYQDNIPATFRAQGNILRWNVKYLRHSIVPVLAMIAPLVLILIQLDARFGQAPLAPGETAILKMRLKQEYRPSQVDAAILPLTGSADETPPLRIDSEREINWRLTANDPGIHTLTVRVNHEILTKRLVVGPAAMAAVSSSRVGGPWYDILLNPSEPPIPESSAVRKIEIGYPAYRFILFGWRIHWLVAFFVLSVLLGFALKRIFRVEI
ncbi:MAG: hypothetical protein H6Q04_174 [Acidobacteria bacterium]|nr:hypothetical protein [Acidobacteriota bacterium]